MECHKGFEHSNYLFLFAALSAQLSHGRAVGGYIAIF